MPAVWALSDLHLSLSGAKPMDVFGAHWEGHASRMAEAWDRLVAEDDVVVSPGDLSWARKPAEAAVDLAWLATRPGWKVLVKGNHDHWWPSSRRRMAELLPPRVVALKKTAAVVQGLGFFGARGGDFAPLPEYGDTRIPEEIEAWLSREEQELRASVADLDRREAESGLPRGPRICLFHYPPLPPGSRESRFTRIVEAAGAAWCVYGHLHGPEVGPSKVEGEIGGVAYLCASCDQVGFEPRLVARV